MTRSPPLRWRADAILAVLLAVAAFALSSVSAHRLSPVIYDDRHAKNLLFDADPARVVETMTNRESAFQRFSLTHPVHSGLTYPFTFALRHGFGLTPLEAVVLLQAATAATWAATLFLVLRLIGCRRPDALLFSALGLASAAATVWLAVPETYALGSTTILWAVGLAALARHRFVGEGWFSAASALSLSVTVTNWMAGLWATAAWHPWKRAVRLSGRALLIVVLAWAVQRRFFPASRFFLEPSVDPGFVLAEAAGGVSTILRAFLAHAVVLPALIIQPGTEPHTYLPVLSIQHASLGSGGAWAAAATVAWGGLLGLGAWGLWRRREEPRLSLVIAGTLGGQLLLHLLWGTETFLYALNFAPLLILVAAHGALTRWRPLVLALAALATVGAGVGNHRQFDRVVDFLRSRETEAWRADSARRARPGEPFPRNRGHVILAVPGTLAEQKGYHELGGNFSPAPGSFGVSVRVIGPDGRRVASSEELPAAAIRQQFAWRDLEGPPGIVTEAGWYRVVWASEGPGRWTVKIRAAQGTGVRTELVIRSVGPAGGPIRTLAWDHRRLSVNDRWSITPESPPAEVFLGDEGTPGWDRLTAPGERIESPGGWGAARIALVGGGERVIRIEDGMAAAPSPIAPGPTRAVLQLDLPDARFVEALNAQVAHLMMGLVGRETRPGDPLSFDSGVPRVERRIRSALSAAGLEPLAPEAEAEEAAAGPRARRLDAAHRALLEGRSDAAWTTLAEFWTTQESPGLFAWSEPSGPATGYHRWEPVRGWTERSVVTPEYEIAAQMLLLQLAMLGDVDRSAAEQTVMLGAGVLPEWLEHPMTVRGLRLGAMLVDWRWDGREVIVTLPGAAPRIRLGPAFPSATPVRVVRSHR